MVCVCRCGKRKTVPPYKLSTERTFQCEECLEKDFAAKFALFCKRPQYYGKGPRGGSGRRKGLKIPS